MDTKERVPAQHFYVPIPEVEDLVWYVLYEVGEKFVIGRIQDSEVG